MSSTPIVPADAVRDFAQDYRTRLFHSLDYLDFDSIQRAALALRHARDTGHNIFTCGNGGSASTASHFATDILKGASYNRQARFKILALTDSSSTITAYSNDVAYSSVFTEQLKNFAVEDDVFIAISGSGNSPSVVEAMRFATQAGCTTIALTGRDGGSLGSLSQIEIRVREQHMGRIEDAHLIVCHMLCYFFIDTAA